MSLKSQNSWLRRISLAVIAALALGTATIPTAPAQAALRLWAGPGGINIGVVQHPHHDWWRQPYGWYTNPDSPRNYWASHYGYGYGWYR